MSAVEDFCREFPDRAEIARPLFRAVRAVRNQEPLIHQDGRKITFLDRRLALEFLRRFEREAAVLLKAHLVLKAWCSNRRDLSADVTEDERGNLMFWIGGDTAPTKKRLRQASAVVLAHSARLLRQAYLLRREWGVSRRGGRPESDAVLLKPLAGILNDQPERVHRLWAERLAPELLGRDLPRKQQRERRRTRRAKRRARKRPRT